MISDEILAMLKTDSAFFNSIYHGINHWRTVERNGLYLAQFTGADPAVVTCFAYFHDCMRENEAVDPRHGARGMNYMKANQHMLDLSQSQLDTLISAGSGHTYGRKTDCATIATCWDADRLDIGRVGITPNSKFMFSAEAKRIADQDDFSILTTQPMAK